MNRPPVAASNSRRRLKFMTTGRLSVLVLTLLLAGCRTPEVVLANAPTVLDRVDRHLNIAYGADPRQRLNLFSPRGPGERPIVIFWYGGSWIKGRKSDYSFVGTTLAERGFVVVIPDYRLFPQVTFPAFDEDGARAVDWVEQHGQQYGGDVKRIVLMGHSAGGHTAAFLAFNHAFLEKFGADPRSICGLVGLSGTYVLAADSAQLRATFPPPYTEQDWQPIHFVDRQAPATLLLHGLSDTEVLPQEAIDLRDALLRDRVRVELHLYPHRGHGETVASFAPLARWLSPAVADTVKFIQSVTTTGECAAVPDVRAKF